MRTTAQSSGRRNLALKLAIVASGHKQQDIALRAGIAEVRLSKIVSGGLGNRRPVTPKEQKALARVLRLPIADLFPPTADAEGKASTL